MQSISHNPIKKDGTFPINANHSGSKSAVMLSGTLGGATTNLVVYNAMGNSVPMVDANDTPITLAINTQDVINHGAGKTIYLQVTGADASTNIVLESSPLE